MSWKPFDAHRVREQDRRRVVARRGGDAVLALGEPAPGVLVAQRALQRHPVLRPLILHVERVEPRAVAVHVRRDALRERDREAVEEQVVLDARVHRVVVLLLDLVGGLIADLQVVRAGHVGRRGPPHVVLLVDVGDVAEEAPRRAVGVEGERRARARMRHQLEHRDEVHQRAARLLAAPAAVERRDAGLEQQLVGERRAPAALDDLLAVVPHVARFRRAGVEAAVERDPVVAAVAALLGALFIGRAGAVVLIVVVEADLVARGELVGEPDGPDLLVVGVAHLQAAVFHVRPRVRIAGVLVAVLSGHHGVAAERAQLPEEPQLVAHDRPAHREAGVPVLDEARDFAEAVAAQLVVEVVALRPLAGGAPERGAVEGVAAGLGHHVEGRAAAIHLAQAARHGDLDFRGVHRVVAEAGHAAAVEGRADVHAVDLHRAFVAAPAVRGEEHHRGVGAVVEAVVLDTGDGGEQVAVAARGRQRRDHRVVEHRLLARAGLHVHHRRLARHRDGFLQAADAHVDVDGDDGAARPTPRRRFASRTRTPTA